MGRSKNSKKRKKSSESGNEKSKSVKHGGHRDINNSNTESSGIENDSITTHSDGSVHVSDLLKSTNDILFGDELSALNMSDTSVFVAGGDGGGGGARSAAAGKDGHRTAHTIRKDPTIADVFALLGKMDTRMGSIEKRLERLESVEAKVDKVDKEIQKLWLHIDKHQKRVDERLGKVEERHDNAELNIGLTNDKVTTLERQNKNLADNLVYLQSQSMRNNLLFSNIDEAQNEVPDQTEQKLRQFMVEKLEMAQGLVDGIAFERVHRMGPQINEGIRKRTIVAKFTLFKDREVVRKLRGKLRNSSYYINEQFPKEVADKRKALKPQMMEAIRNGKRAWLAYDKLYIDGKLVKGGE